MVFLKISEFMLQGCLQVFPMSHQISEWSVMIETSLGSQLNEGLS